LKNYSPKLYHTYNYWSGYYDAWDKYFRSESLESRLEQAWTGIESLYSKAKKDGHGYELLDAEVLRVVNWQG
jgi:hypothetical protein